MIAFSFEIDPHLVLGVPPGASLQEIRDAYHREARRFHPEAGGADWTFRVLAQAYETLSVARIEQASHNELGARNGHARASDDGLHGSAGEAAEPARLVGVEKLWVRYEADPCWLAQEAHRDEHSLSCSLNFKWPNPRTPFDPSTLPDSERLFGRLTEVFEAMCVKTRVATSRIRISENSFTGWLSYPTVERADQAYRLLQGMLKAHGFGVEQWGRDLLIPRTWR